MSAPGAPRDRHDGERVGDHGPTGSRQPGEGRAPGERRWPYPIFLDLRDRPCVVVGGDEQAEAKVAGLLDAGARVRLIAARPNAGLQARVAAGEVDHLPRDYRDGDLDGAFLVIAVPGPDDVGGRVRREADRRGVPVNVVDDPPNCGFILPSRVRRGDLTVAISTGGKAPALAVRLRQRLEARLGPEYAAFLELAGSLRDGVAGRVPDFEARRRLWYRLVDSEVLELLRDGDLPAACRRARQIVGAEDEAGS